MLNHSDETRGADANGVSPIDGLDQRPASMPLVPGPDCRAVQGVSTRSAPRGKSNFVAAVGNFSIQYNFVSASIALQVLGSSGYLGYPLYPEPQWSKDIALAVVFLGAMLGMVTMGRLGDVVGRNRALLITLSLTGVGALVPACAFGPPDLAYGILCLGRLISGIGVGGIFPLSAVHSAEGSGGTQNRGSRITKAFFWQSIGMCVPYLVAMMLFCVVRPDTPSEWVPQLEFRLLFALGFVPVVVNVIATAREEESEEFRGAQRQQPGGGRGGALAALRAERPEVRRTLMGTAGTWFFYDICYYGSSTFTPQILNSICIAGTKHDGQCDQTLFQLSWQAVVVQAFGIPSTLLAMALIDRIGCKRLNVIGLLLLCANFLAMAVVSALYKKAEIALFALLCSLTFLLNFGPNVGSYVLPAICFPTHLRSTCHGLSSFGGKTGAAIGTLMFPAVKASSLGIPGVMALQAILSAVGALVSQVLLKHDWEYLRPEDKCGTDSFLEVGAVGS